MRVSDEQIIAALFSTSSNKEAAALAGISTKTLYSRLAQPEFQEKVRAARRELLESVATEIQRCTTSAVRVIAEIREDEMVNPAIRLQAADAILRHTVKLTDLVDLSARLEAMESKVNDMEKGANQ